MDKRLELIQAIRKNADAGIWVNKYGKKVSLDKISDWYLRNIVTYIRGGLDCKLPKNIREECIKRGMKVFK